MPRCACCDRPLGEFGARDWCEGCLDGLLTDARLLRSGDRDAIGANVDWLRDRGCLTLAQYVTRVPFDQGCETGRMGVTRETGSK